MEGALHPITCPEAKPEAPCQLLLPQFLAGLLSWVLTLPLAVASSAPRTHASGDTAAS